MDTRGVNEDTGEELEVKVIDSSAMALMVREEIDMQITTAKRFPRSITNFKRNLLEQVTADAATAARMGYTLPARKGDDNAKPIKGPSVRLAEVAAASYQNSRIAAQIVDIGERFVMARGAFHDLENNYQPGITVMRSIVNRSGRRFSENMIQVTCQAAVAIAFREAVFKGIPRVYINEAYQKAMAASTGKGTMDERRANALAEYAKHGFKADDVFALLRVKGLADVGVDELISLSGYMTSVEEGQLTWEELLIHARSSSDPKPGSVTVDSLVGGATTSKDDAKASHEKPAKVEEVKEPPSAKVTEEEVEAAVEKMADPTEAKAKAEKPDKKSRADKAGALFGEDE